MKVFFLVVSFGLFHGLIFLPVVLSLIGPKSQHLDIADELEETQTWAEKSVSNMGFLKDQVAILKIRRHSCNVLGGQR